MSEYTVVKRERKRQNGSRAVVRAVVKKQGAAGDGGLLPMAMSEPKTAGIQVNIFFFL